MFGETKSVALYFSTMSKRAAPTFDDYEKALHQMLDENEALQAELTQVRNRLDAMNDGVR